jgi:hypothetical protein
MAHRRRTNPQLAWASRTLAESVPATVIRIFETLECRLFRGGLQFCSGLVDLVVGVRRHRSGSRSFPLAGELRTRPCLADSGRALLETAMTANCSAYDHRIWRPNPASQ